MRTAFDLTPYRRSTVGFDRLFDALESSSRADKQDDFPPFDIVRTGDDRYRVTLAVAGFTRDEIDITAQQNQLVIAGQKAERNEGEGDFVHRGIALRSFERRFQLADYVEVKNASYADGLLNISLERVIPDTMKPRKIEIGSAIPDKDDRPRLSKEEAA